MILASLLTICVRSKSINSSCSFDNFLAFNFFNIDVLAMIFPLRTALAASHKILGLTSPVSLSC